MYVWDGTCHRLVMLVPIGTDGMVSLAFSSVRLCLRVCANIAIDVSVHLTVHSDTLHLGSTCAVGAIIVCLCVYVSNGYWCRIVFCVWNSVVCVCVCVYVLCRSLNQQPELVDEGRFL